MKIISRNNLWALESSVKYNWHIFPVVHNTKTPPKGSKGKNDATNDINRILDWYRENPSYNFGYNLDLSGISVLDVDCHGSDGNVALENLLKMGLVTKEQLLAAYIQKSPSGTHYIFRTSRAFTQTHLGEYSDALSGIDLLNKGCSCMAAGSVVNGVRYCILNRIPELNEIGYFPVGLISYIEELRAKKRCAVKVVNMVKDVSIEEALALMPVYTGGGRNNYIASCAGRLTRMRCVTSEHDLYIALLAINAGLPEQLPQHEVRNTAMSIWRYK